MHKQHLNGQIKFSTYMKLLRLALTNLKVGPPVAEVIELLGKERSIRHLTGALEHIATPLQSNSH